QLCFNNLNITACAANTAYETLATKRYLFWKEITPTLRYTRPRTKKEVCPFFAVQILPVDRRQFD
ncbi:hypothetical protein, partial [Peribacillus simplex]|uniref:hypothetical protein n=1 Tax=Peribacillus simplex TaxID=1478 RepID=UPI003D2E7B8C